VYPRLPATRDDVDRTAEFFTGTRPSQQNRLIEQWNRARRAVSN
jgi:hypothetical protein